MTNDPVPDLRASAAEIDRRLVLPQVVPATVVRLALAIGVAG